MWTLRDLYRYCEQGATKSQINGKWVPARPLNWTCRSLRERFREAIAVFTGKADCFTWDEGQ